MSSHVPDIYFPNCTLDPNDLHFVDIFNKDLVEPDLSVAKADQQVWGGEKACPHLNLYTCSWALAVSKRRVEKIYRLNPMIEVTLVPMYFSVTVRADDNAIKNVLVRTTYAEASELDAHNVSRLERWKNRVGEGVVPPRQKRPRVVSTGPAEQIGSHVTTIQKVVKNNLLSQGGTTRSGVAELFEVAFTEAMKLGTKQMEQQ